MSDDENPKVGRYEWERLLRRCVLPATTKYVGFVMAQYAAKDGSRIFPGVTRLAAVTGLSEKTVRTAQANLRRAGMVERVYEGGRRGTQAFADVYRLVIPVDLLDRVELLPPDELPNRQELPAGNVPNRNLTASQPVNDSSQPVTEGVPTGNGYRPTDHLSPIDQTEDQRDESVEDVTTRGDLLAELIKIDELAARRAASQ